MNIVYYVAASLDGYIAKLDGDVTWLDDLGVPMEETGYANFFAGIDGLIMGRKTWEQIAGFGEWPYGDLPTWVISSQAVEPIDGFAPQPRVPLSLAVEAARSQGVTGLWAVGGGQLAAGLLNAGLLTEIVLTQMPIILGRGIGLFSGVKAATNIVLESSMSHPAGYVQSVYNVINEADIHG